MKKYPCTNLEFDISSWFKLEVLNRSEETIKTDIGIVRSICVDNKPVWSWVCWNCPAKIRKFVFERFSWNIFKLHEIQGYKYFSTIILRVWKTTYLYDYVSTQFPNYIESLALYFIASRSSSTERNWIWNNVSERKMILIWPIYQNHRLWHEACPFLVA